MLDYGDLVAERTRVASSAYLPGSTTTIAAQAIPLLFPHNVKQSSTSYLTWAGIGLTRLFPVVLILAMTAEWSQRTAMSTFTLEPRRGCQHEANAADLDQGVTPRPVRR
jgi:hypothetical protein